MLTEQDLRRLTAKIEPSSGARARISTNILARIDRADIREFSHDIQPSLDFRTQTRTRLMHRLVPQFVRDVQELVGSESLGVSAQYRLRDRIVQRLHPRSSMLRFAGMKWAAACAAFLLIVRTLPLFLIAPITSAEAGVQIFPTGNVVMLSDDGVEQRITQPSFMKKSSTIRTDKLSSAVILIGGDGVVRLQPSTDVHIQFGDLRQETVIRPSTGHLWALGVSPTFANEIAFDTSLGMLRLHAGSIDLSIDQNGPTISVYDRGVTLAAPSKEVLLVAPQRLHGPSLHVETLPPRVFLNPWVQKNLEQDAAHRDDIAKRLALRRTELAGILPTSIFYPAKRIAEHVDTFFSLTDDARTQKRLQQANVRLSEALALMKEGQGSEASGPLSEYSSTLLTMAASQNDNLVKSLIRRQIADASIGVSSDAGTGSIQLLRLAVNDVNTVLPNTALNPKDIEGYILVDTLGRINQDIRAKKDPRDVAELYAGVRPYIKDLLTPKNGAHPLLQREAQALIVSTTSLTIPQEDASISAIMNDLSEYVPDEHDSILVSEQVLNRQVQDMYDRIFVFRHPRSRYNQLLAEMTAIQHDPNRGTLLRRLKFALPDGLSGYVNTEIQTLGDELKHL